MSDTIRRAALADAPAILAIYAPYITETPVSFETEVPLLQDFVRRMENIMAEYPYLVCEIDGNIAGFAYASKHRERAAYRFGADVSIYIHPAYHRRGIGKALYTALFALLKEQNIYTLYAGITLPNDGSVGLHKSLGFAAAGTFRNAGYKQGKWHDVIWLEKPLREYDHPEGW
jgi:phosphinothricin acetyltransferase